MLNPKSAILSLGYFPALNTSLNKIFYGLRSLWVILLEWSYCTPLAISNATFNESVSENLNSGLLASVSHRLPP